jgi:hypothetical protein
VVLQWSIVEHVGQGAAGLAAAFDVAFWWSIAFTAAATFLIRKSTVSGQAAASRRSAAEPG